MATYGHTFTSGDTVTPTKLNSARTVSDIQAADISDAQITAAKLATNAVETAKINASAVTTAKLADANVTFAKLEAPQYTGFRNRIINGNFDIWQRGTSFTSASTEYTSDRWVKALSGSSCTVSRQVFTAGQTDVPYEPTYFLRAATTTSAGSNNNVIIGHRFEDVRTFAGQSATISFYAKADAAKSVALEFVQYFGTGGSPSSVVTAIGSQKISLTTSWQKFTATISIPSISGKTIGTNGNHYLELNIWLDAGSNFNSRTDSLGQQSGTFDIAQVQVEQGSKATPFEARPIGTELALCQRYYQTGTVGAVSYASSGVSVQRAFANFVAQMRTAPAVTLSVNSGALTVPAALGQFTNGFVLSFGSTGAGVEGTFNWTASAEL